MPLLWVSISFLFGLVTGDRYQLSVVFWLVLSVLALSLAFFDDKLQRKFTCWGRGHQRLRFSIGVLLLIFSLGGLRTWSANHPNWQSDDLAWYNDKGEYLLTGWVSAAPDHRSDMTVYQLTAIEIIDPENSDWVHAATRIHGKAQVRMSADSSWQYGDLLQFTARPDTPSENKDFSYRDYLAKSKIYTVIYHPQDVTQVGNNYGNGVRKGLIDFRDRARQTIFKIFPQPESGLLTGILLGIDNDLPPSLAQSYRDTGVAHIIAISGFNMAILAGLFLLIFTRLFGPYWAALISGILLGFYSAMVDVSASVTRALIMAVVGMGGHLIGRRQEGLNALSFTAALLCLINPLLINDVSFQLSFAATFGLVVFAQPMQDWLTGLLEKKFSEQTSAKWTKPLSEYFLFTLAAQFATLPFLAAHFGRISISALLANPLVLPAQPAVMITGAITTLAGMLHPLFGKVFMVFSWPFLKYTNFMVTLLTKIKGGVLTIHPVFVVWIFLVFAGVAALFFLKEKLGKFFQSNKFIWIIFLLVAAGSSIWSIALHQPDGKLHLHLIRCENETSIYLLTPDGKTFVVNPRGNMDELTSLLEQTLSPWSFHLDSVIITDQKISDSLVELAGQINIRKVLLAPTSYQVENENKPLTIPNGIEFEKIQPGQRVEIQPDVWLTLLAEDTKGTALFLQYGNTRILIPNGVDFAKIKSDTPDALNDLTALILGEEDTSYIPPRVWKNLNPQSILWRARSVSPFENSLGMDALVDIHLVSNGLKTWIAP